MHLDTARTHETEIAGAPVALPIIQLDDRKAIALLMVIDMGIRFGDRVGEALAAHFAALKPEIIVGSATLGIPVAIEVSRRLGIDHYVILQKSPKFHLADALVEEVRSVTSTAPQRLLLDRRSIALLQGRRVLVVDDVVATGSSMAAALRLVRRAGGCVVGAGTILTEGNAWRAALGQDATLLHGLGHIPQFDIIDGEPVADPATEAAPPTERRIFLTSQVAPARKPSAA
ncbi:adenine phosphoribosyltransferase [Xaviernesmea oryzae]|uniref:Adenine phosphoribosyltransferase n=1 Tax=Xaviernesmea oryzae TaxID=464029 RepID=A0A1Q9B3D8_9HYPH|nr:phosphoribosyltransferase family protein [Xaviernesmea oryzae]OLP62559.1 adenine phosphoribosyltransferase [Xaviernesmea oryzae]SEM19549.1 adenine phosphoribosyltransferase [Xaviernesmea oryzae]